MNLVTEFIKYFFKAKGKHGTHSPFVYNFVSKCLITNMDNNFVIARKKLFKSLKNDKRIIQIEDFGAGSKKLGLQRKVSSIFNLNTSKGKYGILLYKIVQYYQPQNILEFGTSLGVGSFQMAIANPLAKVVTVEACSSIQNIAIDNLQKAKISNISFVNSTFSHFLENYKGHKFDLVFIDGHHDGEALTHYIDLLEKITHNDTIFILDDIRWSDSMFGSWQKIVQDKHIHLTMDLFRMGILIKRKQQEKEHFIIRY
ncbi:MAG: class I SAM-dependent methyltransferase [Flavobacteriia bacterium]|nr:class I SAM-dependent methyltransferase [Flavobacteriia bacterium]